MKARFPTQTRVIDNYDLYYIRLVDNSPDIILDRASGDELHLFLPDADMPYRKVTYLMSDELVLYATDINMYSQPDSFYMCCHELLQPYLRWAERHLTLASLAFDENMDNANLIEAIDRFHDMGVVLNFFLTALENKLND